MYCTPTGNPLPIGISLPLVNASVAVSCNVGTANVVTFRATTNLNGFFSVTFPASANLNFNLTTTRVLQDCVVTTQLPVLGCLALPRVGVLGGYLAPVGLIIADQGLSASIGSITPAGLKADQELIIDTLNLGISVEVVVVFS
ncbi:hypothetical protein ACH5RR_016013 [Cinchona calisaya]|uniref:Uncharacterized protein n=1 Tax=Cinchona calisaya TaxID=153742 RepID=A0ABD2ZUS3_9GENT